MTEPPYNFCFVRKFIPSVTPFTVDDDDDDDDGEAEFIENFSRWLMKRYEYTTLSAHRAATYVWYHSALSQELRDQFHRYVEYRTLNDLHWARRRRLGLHLTHAHK